jgi:hypothetical protein
VPPAPRKNIDTSSVLRAFQRARVVPGVHERTGVDEDCVVSCD